MKGNSKNGRSGNDLFVSDTRHAIAAKVHKAADRPSKEMAALTGLTVRRHNQIKKDGVGGPIDGFLTYLSQVADPFQVEAIVRAWVKRTALSRLNAPGLIQHLRELFEIEKISEARDTLMDLNPGATCVDHAHAALADAAIDLEKAAAWLLLGEQGIRPKEVLG